MLLLMAAERRSMDVSAVARDVVGLIEAGHVYRRRRWPRHRSSLSWIPSLAWVGT